MNVSSCVCCVFLVHVQIGSSKEVKRGKRKVGVVLVYVMVIERLFFVIKVV